MRPDHSYKEGYEQQLLREAHVAFPECGPWGIRMTAHWGRLDAWDDHESALWVVHYDLFLLGRWHRIKVAGDMTLTHHVKVYLMDLHYSKPKEAA